MIYADHAATTKLDPEVFEQMKQFMLEDFWNASEPYSFARVSKNALKSARQRIADCINAEPDEIFVTSCGSESDNWAVKSVGLAELNKCIITSEIEHHAILKSCSLLEKIGVPVKYLPVDTKGVVKVDSLSRYLASEQVSLVSVMLVNNEIGAIQPIKKLCEIAHAHGALFHTDAVQAIGHIPVDVKELGIDMMSASAHKFNGPKGVGFLYVKKGTPLIPFVDGGSQEFGKRAGTENVASVVGMSYALEKNCLNLEKNFERLKSLEKFFMTEISKTDLDFIINGSKNKNPGNISVSFKNVEGEMLLHRLDLMGIAVSTGSACNSEVTELSHVIKAIGVPEDYAYGTIRISLGYENTEEEIIKIISSLERILKR